MEHLKFTLVIFVSYVKLEATKQGGIYLKNTRLDESASIYNHSTYTSEKEKWNALSHKGKIEYFKDYYLKYCILGLLLILLLLGIFHTIFSKKDTVFTLSIINGTMTDKEIEHASSMLSDSLNINLKKEELLIDQSLYTDNSSSNSLSSAAQQKLSVYSYSGQYDILIAEQSIFEEYASYGYFSNLEELLPSSIKSNYLDSFLGAVPYGISIKNNPHFDSYTKGMTSPVLSIFHTSKQKERALQFLSYYSTP